MFSPPQHALPPPLAKTLSRQISTARAAWAAADGEATSSARGSGAEAPVETDDSTPLSLSGTHEVSKLIKPR